MLRNLVLSRQTLTHFKLSDIKVLLKLKFCSCVHALVIFYIMYLTKALSQVQLAGKETSSKTLLLHLHKSDCLSSQSLYYYCNKVGQQVFERN